MTHCTVLAAAIALSSLTAAPTLASPTDSDVPTGVVHYGDLDLAHSAGVTMLDKRIRRTAETICGDANMRDLAVWTQIRACRLKPVSSTRQQVATAIDHARQLAALNSSATQIASR